MKWLADYIRAKGFKPGIWLIPFATSDEQALPPAARPVHPPRRRQQRLRDPRSQDRQGGDRLDRPLRGRPDQPQGPAVVRRPVPHDLRRLGLRLREDRRPGRLGRRLQRSSATGWPIRRSRPTTPTAWAWRPSRRSMGPKRFLLNCGGQSSSCGYCEGIRIGGDVGRRIGRACRRPSRPPCSSLYMNNICFWTDPDVVCVRPPLTLDQARLWATLVGITGQLLMASDDMPKLPEERVELLRRIFPVADIRPMDLYPLPRQAADFRPARRRAGGRPVGRGGRVQLGRARAPPPSAWSPRSWAGLRAVRLSTTSGRRSCWAWAATA